MKEVSIGPNDSGQRLDKYLQKAFPALPQSLLYKYIRLKRIKVNGSKGQLNQKLTAGDVLQLYINDELLLPPQKSEAWQDSPEEINIVYQDANIILADKPAGMLCHEDEDGGGDTLLNRLKAYLFSVGEWNPALETSFAPALCNRIDRNTAGIVIAAKNAEALRVMNEKIKERQVDKLYLCLVHGTPKPAEGTLTGYILRDTAQKQVTVLDRPAPGGLTAKTEYRVLKSRGGLSLVECRLLTGRTHQIRAQMAKAGHPLVGDTKYGTAAINRGLPFKHQALCSYKVSFDFSGDSGCLEYLKGQSFGVNDVFFMGYFDKLG